MIPYGDALYFAVVLYPVAATILLGLAGRLSRWWILAVSVAVAIAQYSGVVWMAHAIAIPTLCIVATYGLAQWLVAAGFLRVRHLGTLPFYAAVALATGPLLLSRALPLVSQAPAAFLGLSYATFRSVDVLVCIHDGLIASLSPVTYLAYLFFFPTWSAGPIDRYRRFEADSRRRRGRAEFLVDLDAAVRRFFDGLLYKFVLAAFVQQFGLSPLATHHGFFATWAYMYAYSFYLFFDFAGYSSFAIAFSYLLGVHTPENFNRPFFATNMMDFWNRWHITLSTWFRDHVYMRFVMAAVRGRWVASRQAVSCLGFFVTFGLMGLWHGFAARYIVYGLYHASLLSLTVWLVEYRKGRRIWGEGPLWTAAATAVTFNLVSFGFLIFSGRLG